MTEDKGIVCRELSIFRQETENSRKLPIKDSFSDLWESRSRQSCGMEGSGRDRIQSGIF